MLAYPWPAGQLRRYNMEVQQLLELLEVIFPLFPTPCAKLTSTFRPVSSLKTRELSTLHPSFGTKKSSSNVKVTKLLGFIDERLQ